MTAKVIASIAGLFLFAVSCFAEYSDIPQFSDPKKKIEVEAGTVFVIVLDSNKTTGYEWQLARGFDKYTFELIGTEYVRPSSAMPGAPGKEKWTFKVLVSRKFTQAISFEYVRPWEKDKPPVKDITFMVLIAKSAAERQLDSMQRELLDNQSWSTHTPE